MMISRFQHILFHRHLLWEFLRRDLQARYVGSVMGFFWSVINPLILLAVYTVVFGTIFEIPIPSKYGQPRTIDTAFYIFCGLLPWYAFQESLIRSTTSVVDNSHLIKQVRFPAKILPAYLTLSSIVNQLIGTTILLIALLIAGRPLHLTMLGCPLILLFQMIFMFGVGLIFATFHAYIRDIAPLVSIATMILMWSAPLFYPIAIIKEGSFLLPVIYSNPITYLVMINHDLFLAGEWPSLAMWVTFAIFSLVFFTIGYLIFTRHHNEFADLI